MATQVHGVKGVKEVVDNVSDEEEEVSGIIIRIL
jgi:hypothetical protein